MSSTSDAGKTNSDKTNDGDKIPSENTPKSIRRFGISSMMAIQIIGAFIILIGVNLIAFEYGRQIDLTRQSDFTLSKPTLKNLQSEKIQKRKGKIKIIAVIDAREFSELQKDSSEDISIRIKGKLQQYVDYSNQKIQVEFVDPIVERGRTLELSERYKHSFSESMLIIDAYDEKMLDEQYIKKLQLANPDKDQKTIITAAKETLQNRHLRFLPAKELFYFDRNRNYDNQAFVAAWKDESEITTNLMRAVEGKPKTVYFLYDKCRLDSKKGGPAPWQFIQKIYRSQNIQVEKLSLAQSKTIPDDADGIALISPSVDFSDEELAAFAQYWEMRPKASILITLDPEAQLPKLYSYLLRTSHLKPQKNRLISMENKQVLVNAEVEFLQGPEINGDLSAKSTTFEGASQSIFINKVSDNTKIESFPLIQVASGWWGETKFGASNINYDRRYDHTEPLYLGAAVTRGKLNNQITAPLVSKLVMLGNSDFLSQENIRPEQLQYLGQVGNWLVGREPLMNIKQHLNQRHSAFIARGHSNFLSTLFTFIVPTAALIMTGFIWNIRRS